MHERLPIALAAASITLAMFSCGDGAETADLGSATSGGSATPDERCEAVKASVEEAGFGGVITVRCEGDVAYLGGDTYPDHERMTGIVGTNEQVPVPAPGHESPIPLAPRLASSPLTVDGALGVAINGVPIYDYSSQGTLDPSHYDPAADTKALGQLDACNGHAGRGDDYHYHAAPICMMEAMANKGPGAILGWALDGYPIYGNENPDGSAIASGELDVCNDKADETFGRRYHTSDAPPYITQCLVGEVDEAKLPRVAPLDKLSGGGKAPGTPPQGGVQNLVFTEQQDGARTMSYQHGGEDYHITYAPSATAGCWDFDEKTVTNGGVATTATYCRKP